MPNVRQTPDGGSGEHGDRPGVDVDQGGIGAVERMIRYVLDDGERYRRARGLLALLIAALLLVVLAVTGHLNPGMLSELPALR